MGFKVDEIYPAGGNRLGTDDLKKPDGTYGATTATIQNVDMAQLTDQKSGKVENKLELFFVGKEKTVLLNKTNAGNLSMAWGGDTDAWLGRVINISVHMTNLGPGLKIEPNHSAPAQQAAPTPAPHVPYAAMDRQFQSRTLVVLVGFVCVLSLLSVRLIYLQQIRIA